MLVIKLIQFTNSKVNMKALLPYAIWEHTLLDFAEYIRNHMYMCIFCKRLAHFMPIIFSKNNKL
jgi:hypothetical protein